MKTSNFENGMRNFWATRLELKERELAHRKDVFKVMVENEIDTGNFERNAMSDLALMWELKAEINELKYVILNYDMNYELTQPRKAVVRDDSKRNATNES